MAATNHTSTIATNTNTGRRRGPATRGSTQVNIQEKRQAALDRRTPRSLEQFCIAQHDAFAANDWLQRSESEIEADAMARAARYLSMTSWYGYEDELEQIAEALTPCPLVRCDAGLSDVSSVKGDFNLSHFATKVRAGLLRRRGSFNRRCNRSEQRQKGTQNDE